MLLPKIQSNIASSRKFSRSGHLWSEDTLQGSVVDRGKGAEEFLDKNGAADGDAGGDDLITAATDPIEDVGDVVGNGTASADGVAYYELIEES